MLTWACKTCGYDMTEGVEKFMGDAKVVILVCKNNHVNRFLYREGVEKK